MTEETQPGAPAENPTDEDLDVEGPNESTQPSGAPELDDDGDGGDGDDAA